MLQKRDFNSLENGQMRRKQALTKEMKILLEVHDLLKFKLQKQDQMELLTKL
jgi:hypothetical protein